MAENNLCICCVSNLVGTGVRLGLRMTTLYQAGSLPCLPESNGPATSSSCGWTGI